MKWKKFTIHTTTEAEDLVSLMLNENGVEGVQIEDNVPLSEADTKGMFIDILPELGPDDGTSRVSFSCIWRMKKVRRPKGIRICGRKYRTVP